MVTFAASSASSNIFFDVYYLYNNTGYAKTQAAPGVNSFAPGFLLGVNLTRDVSIIGRGYKSSTVENANKDNEKKYSYTMFAGGVEYNHPIVPGTFDFGLGWRTSLLFGSSRTEIEGRDPVTTAKINREDSGMAIQITTGLQANLTPNIALFVDVGYHKSFYIGDLEKKNIGGYQAMAGVRLYLFNIKSIGDNY